MKQISFRDYVELIKVTNTDLSIKHIPLNDVLTLENKHLINFHYLLLWGILGKGRSIDRITNKCQWINYLQKHYDIIESKKKYYKYSLQCLFCLLDNGFYNMKIYYKTSVTSNILPTYINWLNNCTLLSTYANKIKKWYLKYKYN
jgi:hypothetical protein